MSPHGRTGRLTGGARVRLLVALAGTVGAMGGLGACGPRTVAPRPPAAPRPAPTTATPGRPATPPPAASTATPTGAATTWSMAYQPGYAQYVVTSLAAVRIEGDTLGRRDDSVATRARLSLRVSPTSMPNGVVVTVDSFLVSPGRGAPMASALAMPLVLQGQIDPARQRMEFGGAQPMLGARCAGPGETLLALARDLAVPVPAPFQRGRRWSESGTHVTCRSGIPLTVTSRHEWTVEGEVEVGARRLVRVRRETQATVAGTGSGRRAGASVEGTSRTSAEYLLDPAAGRLHAATATSTAELRLRERPDAPVVTSRQEARQEAVLVEGVQR